MEMVAIFAPPSAAICAPPSRSCERGARGAVVGVTNATGAMVSETRYLPFGEVRADVGAITQTPYASHVGAGGLRVYTSVAQYPVSKASKGISNGTCQILD